MPERNSQKIALRLTGWLLIAGLLASSVIGTSTDMTWQWPGYIFLGAAALCAVFAGGWRRSAESKPSLLGDVCLIGAALLCSYVVWRALASPVAYFGREDAALAIAWFVVYALTATVLISLRQRIALVKALALILGVNLVIGFYQFSGHPEFSIFGRGAGHYGERIGGVFTNPNHLAALLAAGVPLFASLVVFGRGRLFYRALFTFIVIMAVICIGLTRSRGGLLALGTGVVTLAAIGLPLAWLFWGRRMRGNAGFGVPLAAFGMITVVAAGLFYANGQALEQRFGANAFKVESNRQLFWQGAQQQLADAPSFWLGAGSRAFRYEGRRLRSPEIHVSVTEAEFVHNDWLQILADYGWIGISLLGLVTLLHGTRALQFIRGDLRDRFRQTGQGQNNQLALTLGAAAGLAAIGVHAIFDFHLHSPAVALWSALLMGLLAAPRPEGEPVRKRSSRSRSSSSSRSRSRSRSRAVPRPPVAPAQAHKTVSRLSRLPILPPLRVVALLGGVTLIIAGAFFVRSEWHFEQARLAYEGQGGDTLEQPLAHLFAARRIDPQNPYVHSLNGHALLLAAYTEADGALPLPARRDYLKKAGRHFFDALTRYPQDINAMMGLAQVFDGLGQHDDALAVLENARLWAPLYGNIAQMQAEQLHALGRLGEAEEAYLFARDATAFGDSKAAYRGLALIKAQRAGELVPVLGSVDTTKISAELVSE